MYIIGIITKTHGINGELKVKPLSGFDEFVNDEIVVIEDRQYVITNVRQQNKLLIVKFDNVFNLEQAKLLEKKEIYANDSKELLADEFIRSDLVGLKVLLTNKEIVGEIADVLDVPQGHLLVVKGKNNPRILIPFIKEFVLEINDDNILVDLPEGLIWKLI